MDRNVDTGMRQTGCMWEEIRMDRTTKWIGGDTSIRLDVSPIQLEKINQ
ncbi:MAG: hypothetical protein HXN29_01735 [Prevotella histicola]|nr:hypothetical protein [Prevotella histicola]MBF1397311.1 hypothetical protein [Prevotella histicola]